MYMVNHFPELHRDKFIPYHLIEADVACHLAVKCGVVGIDILDHCLDIVVNLALGAVVGVRSLLFAMRLFRCCIIVVAGCFSLLCGRCLLLRLVAVELAEDLQRPFRLFLLLSLLDEKHLKACHLVCKRGDLS